MTDDPRMAAVVEGIRELMCMDVWDAEEGARGILGRLDALPLLTDAHLAILRAAGWMIAPPGHVPLPRTTKEAEAMEIIGERMLKDGKLA